MKKTLILEMQDVELINFIIDRDVRRMKTQMKENLSSEDGIKANEYLQENLDKRAELRADIERQTK